MPLGHRKHEGAPVTPEKVPALQGVQKLLPVTEV